MTSMSSHEDAAPHESRQPSAPATLPLRGARGQEFPFPVRQWAELDLELMKRVRAALRRL
jgi:hypothetical protein